ncbi:MAG: methylated-DNA--[protein]-cysteine S-methyltransferase [Actinomycetaceae bacterium]|nr:methylated-DNA--[protein]-cysteine S-methyltransferase [Actinomycetaceae bacterium]
MVVRHTLTVTEIGELCLAANGDHLTGVYFPSHNPSPAAEQLGIWVSPADSILSAAADQLHEYLAGERTKFELPLELPAAGFHRQVWDYLSNIAYGHTASYGEVASALARPRAARAVGTAVAHNPLSIVIPCHRVVAANGNLTGYAGGASVKRYLLDLESKYCGDGGADLLASLRH